jgi:transposase
VTADRRFPPPRSIEERPESVCVVLGHDARLMPAKYVRPYSKGQKNDFRDAEAIAEAVQRGDVCCVCSLSGKRL